MTPRRAARWDLDKTYLRTEFDTVSDLLRTALERPLSKRAFAGATTLLRQLGRAEVATHILSGSPEQMEKKIRTKLMIDGVAFESLRLKPNLKNLLRLRLRALKDQLGFKLPALLSERARAENRGHAPDEEVLFGDDSEADAFVYSLYADLLAGRVRGDRLLSVLRMGRVYDDVIESALSDLRRIPHAPIVRKIFIHLEGQGPLAFFDRFGPRVVPFYNYLQPTLVLHEMGWLSARAVLSVAIDLCTMQFMDGDALVRSTSDLIRRRKLMGTRLSELGDELVTWGQEEDLPARAELELFTAQAHRAPDDASPPASSDFAIDYEALVSKHNPRRA